MPVKKKTCPVCSDGRHMTLRVSPEEASRRDKLVDATADTTYQSKPADEPDDPTDRFCAAFRDLALSVPPSVRKTALKKLDRCGIDPMEESDQVQQVLEKAHQSYTRKKERARESSAKRRAALSKTQSPE